MTFLETRSRRRWRESWAAVASLLVVVGACACSAQTSASQTPSPQPSTSAVATPSTAPTPSTSEVAVARQVLPPATDPPNVDLCSKPVVNTGDGNVLPLQCSTGALNIQAWTYYSTIGASILSLGLNPSPAQPQSAMCDDIAHNGASRSQEAAAYRLAKAYYGWTFDFDPTKVSCQ
jgi:hypothetical protein